MASSTMMPMPMISANMLIMFRVSPMAAMPAIAARNEIGMPMATQKAGRPPRNT